MTAQHSKFSALYFLLATIILWASAAPVSAREMTDFPVVKLQSLDKVTARTMTFEARVGSTVKFGKIFIKVQSCRKAPPIEQPESAAFLQVWEVTPDDEAEWIFSGWMFSSSPGLSFMDHPIYDVWVIDCLDTKSTRAESEKEALPEDGAQAKTPIAPEEKME